MCVNNLSKVALEKAVSPPGALTQKPIFTWLASVTTVPVLRMK